MVNSSERKGKTKAKAKARQSTVKVMPSHVTSPALL